MSEPWNTQAACLNRDPQWWDHESHVMTRECKKAMAICNTCPVRIDCLTTALNDDIDFGIWGGLTPSDRKHLSKRLERIRRKITLADLQAAG
jgi:WhiB family redox-sensing transcriptional regulator